MPWNLPKYYFKLLSIPKLNDERWKENENNHLIRRKIEFSRDDVEINGAWIHLNIPLNSSLIEYVFSFAQFNFRLI